MGRGFCDNCFDRLPPGSKRTVCKKCWTKSGIELEKVWKGSMWDQVRKGYF
tara:strand:+ start:156 stop:308 length:153 start_codon:yes stop_codon:yes gene_type:complete